MGSRNKAFLGDDNDRQSPEPREIPTVSRNFHEDTVDGNQFTKYAQRVSGMNLNDYATRKTIAQGMLDLALLTANAAQLKRIMNLGKEYKFYTLLITLITISICLQVVQACIMCVLAIIFDLNKVDQHRRTNIANNILLMTTIVSVAVNILISTFDIADFK